MTAAIAVLGLAPAAAQATVTATNITTWTSNFPGTPPNSRYLFSYDNQPNPTTLTVTGTSNGTSPDHVDIVCYFGSSPSQSKVLNLSPSGAIVPVPVAADGTFRTPALPLRAIASHACRLRAVPTGHEVGDDSSAFAGPQLAISEAALPLSSITGGPNDGTQYNVYVHGVTFTGSAAWKAPGTPASGDCGGPWAAEVDPAFDLGALPINCAGSLFGDDLGAWGGRSEVVIDGRNAYDPAAAQALIPRTGGNNGSQDLPGFPKSLNVSVDFDPTSGQISSRISEPWVSCAGTDPYKPLTTAACPSFVDTGVRLTRVITTSDGGHVVTLTDTWSSMDGKSHSLDLLYDDYSGVPGNAQGWQFPGQSGFTQYAAGAPVPAPGLAPGSILAHTDVSSPDGDPSQGFGAITFGQAPSGLRFATPTELEEHQLLTVPAGGTASLSYVYSIALTQADVNALAMAAQDRFQPAAVQITSPADGATVSTASVTLSGIATAGSGIKSLVVGGQAVPVTPGGTWSAQVPLSPGANMITALATDGAGVTTQAQVTVVYQPPAPAPPPVAKCHVPRIKGMKLRAAEKALRKAHCRVGKVKQVSSRRLARGRVMSTKPRAGRRLRVGSKIELFVSKGR